MNQTKMIAFDCPGCREPLEIAERAAGKEVRCVECGVPVTVPSQAVSNNTVPVRLGLPKVGQFETQVSKKDASKMAFGFLGGVLTLMGVIVCAMLGINFSKRS